ncbi:outer membrane protein OmpA-like peptidoglycan-associated protein [Winogradskyella wandonensis]|uniref:Outer membrane protein OmpA-like peptidoglycan-associated protein n=1 Tax=Winogradskyella wandonensis TaxID=1442586 RepID=A0A4R1KQR1_9FLAO|nr:OmpA family protein [Winogradskyella wandonensis]TCK66800.1 outer membrane protein OmpA-like peptidoglycan-associated protein [Winogradskyella wandonensis]
MKKLLKYILALVFIQGCFMANSQKSKVKSVNDDYNEFAYVKTSNVLLRVAENGYRSPEMLQQLANSFYFQNKMKEAARWYGELFKLTTDVDSEYYFRYALALKGVQNYEASDEWMEKFNELNPSDSRAKSFIARRDYRKQIAQNSKSNVVVDNLNFNSEYSDFGTAVYDGNLVFASARGNDERTYQWNGQPYLDLFKVYGYNDGEFSNVSEYSSKINTKFHESSVAYMPDGNTIFFTRNNYYRNRAKKGDDGVNKLKLFRVSKDDNGNWGEIKSVHFNSDEYSVAHPTINKEGTRLYFASDMEGTVGDSDIWVVDINEDGSLATPRNLGSSINTEGPDSFPFVNSEGDLYYSTKGLPGLGGYDIFVVRSADEKIADNVTDNYVVTNIGKPFNSNADDFAFYENVENENGFFSSNRTGGKGDDDIYSFGLGECDQVVTGRVKDKQSGALLPGATVVLKDATGNELERVIVGTDAAFRFNVDCDKQYLVRGSKEKYSIEEERFDTNDASLELNLDIGLSPEEIAIQPCDDLAKALNIPLIYFDLDKYDIKYVAELQLQKVLAVLVEYPSMTLDIRSHTDCRASDEYNQKLSENRAQATLKYLVKSGIDPTRLTAKGYGESQLVNDCGCDTVDTSECTELQHQKNRRSEFIITSFKGKKCGE